MCVCVCVSAAYQKILTFPPLLELEGVTIGGREGGGEGDGEGRKTVKVGEKISIKVNVKSLAPKVSIYTIHIQYTATS